MHVSDFPPSHVWLFPFSDRSSTTDEGLADEPLQLAFAREFPGVTPDALSEIASLYSGMRNRAKGDVMFRAAVPSSSWTLQWPPTDLHLILGSTDGITFQRDVIVPV